MPRFSVIVVHYQGSVRHEALLACLDSLAAQTFKDFEILLYHDGPLLDSSVKFPVPVTCTPTRFNDWGHSLRDLGIRAARGDYIVHMNADNELYPFALESLASELARPPRMFDPATGQPQDTDEIVIFPILLMGVQEFRGTLYRTVGHNAFLLLSGVPPVLGFIDCMQLVMKRELWLKEGGWHDKREASDGYMYDAFCKKYGYRCVGPVLGLHR